MDIVQNYKAQNWLKMGEKKKSSSVVLVTLTMDLISSVEMDWFWLHDCLSMMLKGLELTSHCLPIKSSYSLLSRSPKIDKWVKVLNSLSTLTHSPSCPPTNSGQFSTAPFTFTFIPALLHYCVTYFMLFLLLNVVFKIVFLFCLVIVVLFNTLLNRGSERMKFHLLWCLFSMYSTKFDKSDLLCVLMKR